MAAALGTLPVKCGRACDDKATRQRWGCDRDAEEPGYTLRCWECGGRGCDECGHEGRVAFTACPTRVVTPDAELALRAYWWRRDGFLPAPGGMLDQAQSFVEACGFLERLRSEYETRQLEKASKAAKRKVRR